MENTHGTFEYFSNVIKEQQKILLVQAAEIDRKWTEKWKI